jgi:Na+/H+ antiporter NhaC
VRTQLPYALFAASVAIVVGVLAHAVTHLNSITLIPAGFVVIVVALRFFGRPVDATDRDA